MQRGWKTPPEVVETLKTLKSPGSKTRIRHDFKSNGEPCSIEKDACCAVKKIDSGYYWFCFRCNEYGYKKEERTPEETAAHFKQLKETEVYKCMEKIALPFDNIPLIVKEKNELKFNLKIESKTRIKAAVWLRKAHITKEEMFKYEFSWSEYFNRVIIPIYSTNLLEYTQCGNLIGWVGREIHHTKEELKAQKIPKYITRKKITEERIVFALENTLNIKLFIVEDILSAIKLHSYFKVNVIALLGDKLNTDIMNKIKEYDINLWLDGDKYYEAIKYIQKFSVLGFNLKIRHTVKDPKEYTKEEMKKLKIFGV